MAALARAAQLAGTTIRSVASQGSHKLGRYTPYTQNVARFSTSREKVIDGIRALGIFYGAVFAAAVVSDVALIVSEVKKSKKLDNQLTAIKIQLAEEELKQAEAKRYPIPRSSVDNE